MLVNAVQQRLAALQSQTNEASVEALHVMGAIQVVVHDSLSSGPKSFDSIKFVRLHPSSFAAFHYGHSFPGVDTVRGN